MSRLRVPCSERDHARGPADASIVVVEYGDFQCPFCGIAYPILQRLEDHNPDLRVVFRHFPLDQIHPYAGLAAEAAEAAGAQGQFWEMHDLMYENQESLDPESLLDHAAELGLDLARFVDDLEAHRFHARVHDDFMSGVRSGVNGTPTLFINDERWNGPVDERMLSRVFEELRSGTYAHP